MILYKKLFIHSESLLYCEVKKPKTFEVRLISLIFQAEWLERIICNTAQLIEENHHCLVLDR